MINGECKKCDECGASPLLVDEKCQSCFDCENKPGFLRWENDYRVIHEEDKEKLTDIFKELSNRSKQIPIAMEQR